MYFIKGQQRYYCPKEFATVQEGACLRSPSSIKLTWRPLFNLSLYGRVGIARRSKRIMQATAEQRKKPVEEKTRMRLVAREKKPT